MRLGSGFAVALVWVAAPGLILPLAWELPYTPGAALKRKKKEKKKGKTWTSRTSQNATKVDWMTY